MARIVIMSTSMLVVERLMSLRYFVNIKFINLEVYKESVKLGFDKDKWEAKNNNLVEIGETK